MNVSFYWYGVIEPMEWAHDVADGNHAAQVNEEFELSISTYTMSQRLLVDPICYLIRSVTCHSKRGAS